MLHTGLEMFRDIEVIRQPVFVFPIFVKRIEVLDRPDLVSNRLKLFGFFYGYNSRNTGLSNGKLHYSATED